MRKIGLFWAGLFFLATACSGGGPAASKRTDVSSIDKQRNSSSSQADQAETETFGNGQATHFSSNEPMSQVKQVEKKEPVDQSKALTTADGFFELEGSVISVGPEQILGGKGWKREFRLVWLDAVKVLRAGEEGKELPSKMMVYIDKLFEVEDGDETATLKTKVTSPLAKSAIAVGHRAKFRAKYLNDTNTSFKYTAEFIVQK